MAEPLQAALPKEQYVDPQAWALERDAVLFVEWFCIGRLDDLGLDQPGRLAVLDVVGESVLVTSDEERRLHGSYNVCRHRGSQLHPVEPPQREPVLCTASAIRCPYHSWTYALDGSLLRAPHAEVPDPEAFALHPVGVESWGGFVFVHLTPERATPLADAVAGVARTLANYGLERLATGAVLTYDVAANNKVLLENYNECYHCGPVHPKLCRLVPSFAGGGRGLAWEEGIPHREGAWTFTTTGTTTRRPLPGLTDAERERHKGDLVYPNLMLSASADHVAAFVLLPVAVDRTTVVCSLLFDRDEIVGPGLNPSDARDLWDLVNRQDWAVCESVQRGMSSRAYTQGWFAPMEDDSLDIRRWLLPRLAGSADSAETGGGEVSRERFDHVVVGLGALGSAAAIAPKEYVESLDAVGIAYEQLDEKDVAKRWPQFRLPQDTLVLHQADAGIVPAALGTSTMQAQAARHGAVLRGECPVTALLGTGGALHVETPAGVVEAGSVVVCADAWTNQVLSGVFAAERHPLWIWMDDPSYYGFPCYGEPTIKAAQDCGGPAVDPDDRTSEPDPAMEQRLAEHLARTLPGSGEPVRSVRCQYTLTPDRDFVLAPVPGHDSVLVGLGAAHGFKFAPTFGRLLADLAADGGTTVDLTPFRLDRPALTDPDYAPHWLV